MKQLTREEKISEIYEKISECDIRDGIVGLLIGDVLDYRENIANNKVRKPGMGNGLYWIGDTSTIKLQRIWKHKRLPIDDQTDKTVDFIHSLLEQGKK